MARIPKIQVTPRTGNNVPSDLNPDLVKVINMTNNSIIYEFVYDTS